MSERDPAHNGTDERLSLKRRVMMGTLATGTGLAALGSSTAVADQHDENGESDENGENGEDGDGEEATNGDVHPVFGFAGESADVEPPVEPDHEVTLNEDTPAEGMPYPEWYFDPVGLYVEPGDTVQFTLDSHFHTVTAYHPEMGFTQRVPDGVGPISSPVLWEDSYFLYTFEEPGVYDLICLPHEWAGMVIRVVVGEATGPGAEEVPEPTYGDAFPDPDNPIAPDWAAATVLRDPAMDPENIVEAGSVSWDDLEDESKTLPMELLMPGGSESLVAVLSGRAEGVETDASGCAHFTLSEAGLAWDVVLEEISGVTQAHIHEGERGEDGPVVAPMIAYAEELDGSGEGEPQDAAPDEPILEGGVIDDEELVEEILANPSGYYVNVHTTEYPGGEIRGQIRGRDSAEDEEMGDEADEENDNGEDDGNGEENGEETDEETNGDDGTGEDNGNGENDGTDEDDGYGVGDDNGEGEGDDTEE